MLQGKTYLVTGSTDGIGRQTVTRLAVAGAKVLLHGRSAEKLAALKQELDQHAKEGASTYTYTSDFSSFAEVKKLADKVKADHQSIDVLINNAGIFSAQRELSQDGIELTWAVNALAPFLLTSLLLDRLKERIVNVGSMALAHSLDLNNLEQKEHYDGHAAYSQSKLANLMYTVVLAPKLQPRGVTVNCVHPGVVATKVLNSGWGGGGIGVEGADEVFNYASGDALGQQTGKFFADGNVHDVPGPAQDKNMLQQLWTIMQQQTGAQYDC